MGDAGERVRIDEALSLLALVLDSGIEPGAGTRVILGLQNHPATQ